MLTLHPLLSDHAVFQRGEPINIYGSATPGTIVTVLLGEETRSVAAAENGRWSVDYPPRDSGGPYELTVQGEGRELRRKNLVIGEVWLCSGQSNMEWTLAMTPGTEEDIAAANDPEIRVFTVMRIPEAQPAAEPDGAWEVAVPSRAGGFSAVAWFFALQLRAKLGCPVGLIVPAFGGTQIASWLPQEVLNSRPEYAGLVAAQAEAIEEELQPHADEGRTPESAGWEMCDTSAWDTLEVPGMWQQQGWQLNGAVWYRRTVELPAEWHGKDLVLRFGACDDFDDTYVNGERVGGMGTDCPTAYATKRLYPVSSALSAGGRLEVAVRVFDQWGYGGIVNGASLHLAADPEVSISLEGPWKAKIEKAYPLRMSSRPIPPVVLYNGMVHPLLGAAVRGFLWYQGESDVSRAALYRVLLPDLISAWRKRWNKPLLPFGIVQLANHKERTTEPGDSDWAELRDAELLTAQTVPATGLAVTIETGEADNIHPRLKKPVGARLARWALAEVYGIVEEPWHSPLAADHWIEGGAVFIRFVHVGEGLRSREGRALSAFQIAGSDRSWSWADAEIVAPDVVRVSKAGIDQPIAVRYGWQDNPDCTLENSAGLPASPFRTDDWELRTNRK
jgi:sialate O-acetylesterase